MWLPILFLTNKKTREMGRRYCCYCILEYPGWGRHKGVELATKRYQYPAVGEVGLVDGDEEVPRLFTPVGWPLHKLDTFRLVRPYGRRKTWSMYVIAWCAAFTSQNTRCIIKAASHSNNKLTRTLNETLVNNTILFCSIINLIASVSPSIARWLQERVQKYFGTMY